MPPKKKKKTSFSAKERDCIIADLDDRSYNDMLDLYLVSLHKGAQLKWNPTRLQLVEELTKPGRIRKPLNNLTDAMTRKYMALLKVYKTRKCSAQFQQAWLDHIEIYFTKPEAGDEDVDVKSIWKLVCDSFATPPNLQEQRIIVSTMAYIIYNIMTEKVTDYKIHLSSSVVWWITTQKGCDNYFLEHYDFYENATMKIVI